MNREELVTFLNELEDAFPVDKWTINGIHIWPLLKVNLFLKYLFTNIEKRRHKNTSSAVEENSIDTKIETLFKSIGKTLQLISFKRNRAKATILLSEAPSHYSQWNGKKVNRFFYPIEEHIYKNHPDYEVIKVGSSGEFDTTFYDNKNFLNINDYYYCFKILDIFHKKSYQTELPQFHDFVVQLNSKFKNFAGNEQQLLNDLKNSLDNLKIYQRIFSLILKKVQPMMVFELCYYTESNIALNLECRKRNISTIEIQHGGMGPLHICYSGWGKFPEKGYQILPDKIWTWDRVSNNLIEDWVKNQDYHEVFLGGMPWIDFLLEDDSSAFEFDTSKGIILYTVQRDYIEDYIYEAIEKTPNEYIWWLRLHPTKLDAMKDIEKQVNTRGLSDKVEINNATSLPLPIILINCSIHISAYSGSINEAAIMGVKSVLLEDIGVEAFQNLVLTGEAIPCIDKDANVLINIIIKTCNNFNKNEINIIENYRNVMDRLLN